MIIKYSQKRETTAEYLAEQRMIYEYPRAGYVYDESHIELIKNSILGELAFLEFINTHLQSKYKQNNLIEKYQKLTETDFMYQLVIGKADGGFDFKKANKLIDIKTYGSKRVSIEKANNYNLLVDCEQANKTVDYYIQVFILENGDIYLAGFHKGLPPLIALWTPKPCHICPVAQLTDINNIITELNM